ncbi:MAG: AAA family ATPase, partial [Actinomycetota bacterium]|nr:AAA family ATPase [Actinomycetota bacterium]
MASGTEDIPVVLTELSVENVALIEAATLELAPGLNAVTGETGAGKTLLATALQLLLGGRARSETVRAGSKKATVEGSFSLPPDILRTVLDDSLGDLADDFDTDDGLFLRRTLTGDGRSKCHVNGVMVPVRALATLGEKLVSYHGQREQARLTEPAEQLDILDDFLDEDGERVKTEHRELWRKVEEDRRELQEITASSESRLRELDFLRFQVEEIEGFGYTPEEAVDLTRERDRLRNITELMLEAATATAALSAEGDTSTEAGGALEATSVAVSALEGAARHDESLSGLLERLRGVSAEVEDLVYELRAYVEGLEADPARLESVEDRLDSLRTLERKYGEDVDGFLRDSKSRLSRLENLDEETSDIEERISRGQARLGELAGVLSAGRTAAAEELSRKVRENLSGLNLGGAVFKAELMP